MKCAEVMEWMHRYLDHDLSQAEMIEMFRHIDNCPPCADIFDRLMLLSQELEQLPDVKPPFSLVDSILPQLDKLDLDVQQPVTMSDEEPSKVVPITRQSKRSKAAAKGASMAARTGIGAVAAAVILLIAVFNMPDNIPQAEVETSLQQAADTSSSDGAMSRVATESLNTSDDNAESSAASTEIQNNEPEATAFVGTADQDAVRDEDLAEPAESAAVPSQRNRKQPPAVSDTPAVSKQDPPAAHRKEAATPSPDEAADTDESGINQIFSIESAEMADEASDKQEDAVAPSAEIGIMSMLPSLAEQDSWHSPDGRYAAELAGQQLVIYSLPVDGMQEGRVALTSLPLEGTWVSGSWSADGRQYTYVTLLNGTEVPKIYTVPETPPSPAASPQVTASPEPGVTPDGEGNNK